MSSAPSEKADSAVYITEKKPVSAALQRPLSIFVSPLPGNLISLCVQKYGCFEWVGAHTILWRTSAHAHTWVHVLCEWAFL